jgi:hypothetical protein
VNSLFKEAASAPCHCVIDPRLSTPEGLKSREAFIGSFSEDGPYYLEHLEAASHEAAKSTDIIFSPSGGQTQKAARGLSEGETNAAAARAMNYWGHPQLQGRTFPEMYALTSLENVLYLIALFMHLTSRTPERITICGFAFKEERFHLHAQAIQWPSSRFRYVGINNPAGLALKDAILNEARLVAEVKEDPLMIGPRFATKRAKRNPFKVKHPYRGLDPDLDDLFNFMDRNAFISTLPWARD